MKKKQEIYKIENRISFEKFSSKCYLKISGGKKHEKRADIPKNLLLA